MTVCKEKENYMILMEIYYLKEIFQMVSIIQETKKMVKRMEKELNIIPMGKLLMKEISLMI